MYTRDILCNLLSCTCAHIQHICIHSHVVNIKTKRRRRCRRNHTPFVHDDDGPNVTFIVLRIIATVRVCIHIYTHPVAFTHI